MLWNLYTGCKSGKKMKILEFKVENKKFKSGINRVILKNLPRI